MPLPIVFDGSPIPSSYLSRSSDPAGPTFSANGNESGFRIIEYRLFGTVNAPGDQIVAGYTYTTNGAQLFTGSVTLTATQFDSSEAIVFSAQPSPSNFYAQSYLLSNTPIQGSRTFTFGETALGDFSPAAICFVTGTRIATQRGEVPVEALLVGDLALTAEGGLRPVVWIGQRHVEWPAPGQAPVRIRAGAFGQAPSRDLYLSPGHPVLVGAGADGEGGVLVPVMCLVNGTTIARMTPAPVTYWHVELDRHDILLAEGLPAESYLDLGTRAWFAGVGGALVDPETAFAEAPGRCRLVATDGPLVEAERARLDAVFAGALTAQCGWEAAALSA
ncbi:Hint domain-containing protein [Methylorubrum zatmanii]